MIGEAGPEDQPEIEALLLGRIGSAMFPMANLRAHGLKVGGFASDHDHAARFWRIGADSLVALTRGGMVMALLAKGCDLSGLRAALVGVTVTGAIGPTASIRPALTELGLCDRPTLRNDDEPGFTLDLAALRLPDLPGTALVPASRAPRPQLIDWRSAYHGEILGTPASESRIRAEADIAGYLARDSHRVLMRADRPVAFTGFNATLPEIVQIGGVYTPPELRNKGFARQAVALHLAEARERGATRAVLFAASDAAARAYRAIGFQPAEPFTMFILASPTRIAA
ncbi:MAG: GNAT family N-acetyltransferase [Rhodobacterales bacterium]|nr:GNAT family N-acetyltransferase [Rhodobacterales bacterium]